MDLTKRRASPKNGIHGDGAGRPTFATRRTAGPGSPVRFSYPLYSAGPSGAIRTDCLAFLVTVSPLSISFSC